MRKPTCLTAYPIPGDEAAPNGHFANIIGRYHVDTDPWQIWLALFPQTIEKAAFPLWLDYRPVFRPTTIETMKARDLYYLWAQLYNQHADNRAEYYYVMGRCHG
jgi:hypothetical protein